MKEINYKERYETIMSKIGEMYNEAADVIYGKAEANPYFHRDYYTGVTATCGEILHLKGKFDEEDKALEEMDKMFEQLNRKINTVNFILNDMKKDSEG